MILEHVPREIGMGRIAHPDPMRVNGYELTLIVDRAVDPLYDGDTILGWHGDNRLALYFNPQWLRWELWRFEADGVYRMTTWFSASEVRGSEVVGRCILACIGSEERDKAGIHLHDHVVAANDRANAPARDKGADMMGEALERVRWGIAKDTE